MAELYVPKPAQTWAQLRTLVGGPALLLPSTYPMLVGTLLGLSNEAAGLIDAKIPLVGALLDEGKGRPAAVLGLHVVSGQELIADLTTGKQAMYHPRLDKKSGVTLLDPVPGKAPKGVSLGLVGNYLLASNSSEHLVSGGPFVARTLPKRHMPSEPIALVAPKAALSGPIAAQLKQAWADYRARLQASKQRAQARHGGRPADFANPSVALRGASGAVTDLIDVLASAEQLRVVVDPASDHLELRVQLKPGPSGAAQQFVHGMTTGSAQPLLALPGGTAFALIERTTAKARHASAQSTRDAVENLLGSRLGAAQRQQLEKTLGDLARGRGDVLAYALVLSQKHASLVLESSVSDAKAFDRGIRGLIGLLHVPAFAAPLEAFIGRASFQQSTARLPGVSGPVQRVRVRSLSSRPRAPALKPITGLWAIQGGMLYATVGRDSNAVFPELTLAARDPHNNLGTEPQVAAALRPVQNVSFALFADPARLGLLGSSSQASAPVLLSVGKSGDQGVIRLRVARADLESAVRAWMKRQ